MIVETSSIAQVHDLSVGCSPMWMDAGSKDRVPTSWCILSHISDSAHDQEDTWAFPEKKKIQINHHDGP